MLADHLQKIIPFDTIESSQYEGIQSTLLISTPSAKVKGGLMLLRDGKLYNFGITGCMGLWVKDNQLWAATSCADHMRLLIFEEGKATRTIVSCQLGDVHDVRLIGDDLYVVSTATNEIVTINDRGRILKRWQLPGCGDSWHLNCLDVWDGKLVVGAFGKFPTYRGYKGKLQGQGIIFDLHSQTVLAEGFSAPHTPRRDKEGGMFVCNSKKELLSYRKNGTEKEVSFPGAFTRGLDFSEDEIYVGLSSLRHRSDLITSKETISSAQIAILDKSSLQVKRKITLPESEIYEVLVLSDKKR